MKELRCTQCGATINPDTLTCEYCGSVFFSSEIVQERERKKAEKKKQELDGMYIDSHPYDDIKVRNLTNEELYNLIKTSANQKPSGYLFPIVFMIAWTMVAFIIGANLLEDMPISVGIIRYIPFVFALVGVISVTNTLKQAVSGGISNELNLIKQGFYSEACDSLEKRESKKHNLNYVAAIILLCYFRLADYEVAKQNIIALPQKELSELINRSNVFYEVAKELNVRTPEFGAISFSPFKQMIKEQLSKLSVDFDIDDD
ncbi:MAG: hypothetical protein IJE91_02190 [Clostridia bacterium]|nr:hypothetical protein [Clostridia bacterium]